MNSPDGDFEGFLRQFKLSPPSPLPVRQRSRGFALASVILVAAIIPTWLAWKRFTDGDATRPPVSVPSVPGTSNDIRKIERANRGCRSASAGEAGPCGRRRRGEASDENQGRPPGVSTRCPGGRYSRRRHPRNRDRCGMVLSLKRKCFVRFRSSIRQPSTRYFNGNTLRPGSMTSQWRSS